MNPTDLDPMRRRLLTAALPHVPFDGWTGAMLLRAAAEAGIAPGLAARAFPRGVADLLEFWLRETDRAMLAGLDEMDLKHMRVRERIAAAIRIRLTHAAPHREAVRRALALQALPHEAPRALASLYRTVDAIWHAAGDTATDWNFYTKRLLLAGVYSATLLYWLDDKSDGCAETWKFLDRRLGDVMGIQRLRGRLAKLAENLPDPFKLTRRWAG